MIKALQLIIDFILQREGRRRTIVIITKKRVNSSINFNTPNSKSNKIEDVCKIRNELGLSSFFDSHNINDFINIS